MNAILQITAYTPLDDRGQPADKYLPAYPKFGATVAKYRKLPPTPENVKAHAEALFSQLATFQAQEFRHKVVEPERPCPCASGTWHDSGDKILKAVNAQNRAATERALADSWRKRTDAQVKAAYEAAMRGEDAPLVHNVYVPEEDRYR